MAKQVNPTRMELTRLKRRLKTAARGHKLLKDKRDEMVRRFIDVVRRDRELRADIEQQLAHAMGHFSAARAEMGDAAVSESLIYPVREIELKTDLKNVMSVEVPVIKLQSDSDAPVELPYGFAFSSGELDGAVLELAALLPKLIELAEAEKAADMLADDIEKTRRRVNALEHVMIPNTQTNIKYISMKLEENERASQSRLMKVKDIIKD